MGKSQFGENFTNIAIFKDRNVAGSHLHFQKNMKFLPLDNYNYTLYMNLSIVDTIGKCPDYRGACTCMYIIHIHQSYMYMYMCIWDSRKCPDYRVRVFISGCPY